MTTVYDVAEEAKVSIATVSRVFNNSGSVSQATHDKVRAAAAKLNYVPHSGARTLMTRRTDTIGVVLPDMHGEFFSELVKGFDSAARERGLHLLLSCSHDDPDEMAAALASMRGRVDGVIAMSPLINAEALESYVPKDLPLVLVNSDPQATSYTSVQLDNTGGAYRMTRHLIDQGYRRVALISGPTGNQDAEQRRDGYLAAIGETGSAMVADIVDGDFSEDSGYRAGCAILQRKERPDAVFASNDDMAIGCLTAFRDNGVSVPDDIGLAGFDDIRLARLMQPALSSVHVPISKLGANSLAILAAEIASGGESSGRPTRLLEPELRIWDSCERRQA